MLRVSKDSGTGLRVSALPMKNVEPMEESSGFADCRSWQLTVPAIPAPRGQQE